MRILPWRAGEIREMDLYLYHACITYIRDIAHQTCLVDRHTCPRGSSMLAWRTSSNVLPYLCMPDAHTLGSVSIRTVAVSWREA